MSDTPMTHTALIAEDEPLLAQGLIADLAQLWPELTVAAVVGDGASAVAQALALRPAVCFLDIRMPGMTGLEAAQALAEDWPAEVPFPLLVFVTAYEQYAVPAFDAQAVDYLVKPVDAARLAACVQRLKHRLGAESPDARAPDSAARSAGGGPHNAALDRALEQLRALLSSASALAPPPAPRLQVIQSGVGSVVHMVPVSEVLYFEAADKYIRVVTAQREHLIRLSLRELLPQLDAQEFWQVHRGLVVRASAISVAQRDESGKVLLTLLGRSERLTASRLYAHRFKGM